MASTGNGIDSMDTNYTCIIIDDEPLAITVIKNHIEKVGGFTLLGGFTNALDALKVLHREKVDLMFLDIQMPGINGLEFFKAIPQPPKVIFTTAFRNYAAEAFDVDALDYLVKPIPFERFLKAVNKFLEQQTVIPKQDAEELLKDFIILKSDKKNFKVKLDDILYIESLDDYVKVHTKEKTLVCYLRLSGIENLLGSTRFARIHRAYIVNLRHITVFTHCSVEIDSKQIPIGRNYRDGVVKLLG